ncbi:MAG: hypothetical protein II368_05950 [Clostridia bacterium]|nr:hypothetical protein [Clostridia bacterium]MBQ1943166.1 hypothetical protein [Clostridia bacterium]
MKRELEFMVNVYLGGGEGGEISVSVSVSDKEYKMLKECYKAEEDIENWEGLEPLCERIFDAAKEEDESLWDEYADEEDGFDDYDRSYSITEFPSEIIEECDEDDE